MPWDFEDINDDALPGQKGRIDPKFREEWPERIWPWWQALFNESSSQLDLVFRNVTAGGRTTADRLTRREEVRPIFQAALLMLMLDSVTRRRSGPEAAAAETFYRDNLLNLREGDLVTFIDRLKARGVADDAFTKLKQSDFRSKYGLADHGEFHDDMLRYLFQVDLIDSEIEGIWITPLAEAVEEDSASFRSAALAAANFYILYCFASPLRRLRMAVRASSPLVPLVRQCGELVVTEEHRYWVNVLHNLCAKFEMTPRVADNIVLAGFVLDYLTGAVTNLQTLPDPTADDAVASAVSGFDLLFVMLYRSSAEPGEQPDVSQNADDRDDQGASEASPPGSGA